MRCIAGITIQCTFYKGALGKRVESRCGAVILQVRHICCRLFRLAVPYCPDHKSCFHTPLIEADMRF